MERKSEKANGKAPPAAVGVISQASFNFPLNANVSRTKIIRVINAKVSITGESYWNFNFSFFFI